MIERLVIVNEGDGPKPSFDKGDYNTAPFGFEEITAEQFARSAFFTYGAKYVEHRSLVKLPEPLKDSLLQVHMFWVDDYTGFAMSSEHQLSYRYEGTGKKRHSVPQEEKYYVRYFRFGCKHEREYEMSAQETRERGLTHWGMFCHAYYCPDCGRFHTTDSSG